MKQRLPKGKLFSSRRYGRYGNYVTWNMMEALAILSQPPSDKSIAWTSKSIAEAVKMAKQPALLMLERMKEKGWVEWGKNENNKRSWVVTPTGTDALYRELHRHMNFEMNAGDQIAPKLLGLVNRGYRMLHKLKSYGWSDIQARECLINFKIEKIEWAVYKAERKVVENKGAYARALIENGNMDERRCRVYVQKTCPDMDEALVEMIVKESLRSSNPFKTVRIIMPILKGYMGKPDRDLRKRDLEEILFVLYKRKKIESSERVLHRFAG
jgi:DNA-binding MarR family transcriptional regulator